MKPSLAEQGVVGRPRLHRGWRGSHQEHYTHRQTDVCVETEIISQYRQHQSKLFGHSAHCSNGSRHHTTPSCVWALQSNLSEKSTLYSCHLATPYIILQYILCWWPPSRLLCFMLHNTIENDTVNHSVLIPTPSPPCLCPQRAWEWAGESVAH